jgi:CRISPR-associated protein Cas4
MKISVTMLSSYLYCPRKLFLQQVLALEEPPKESLVLGTLRHEVYESINQAEERIVKLVGPGIQYHQLIGLYKNFYSKVLREKIINNKPRMREVNLDMVEVFRKTWPLILNEAELRAENIQSFIKTYNVYGKELWEKLTPKIISELRVESEALQLKGIIDRIEVYEKGYVPIELKTGKMPADGVWPGHRVQIAAYAMLLEEKFHTTVKEGFVNYLDSKEKRHIAINPFMREEITKLVKEVQDLLKHHYPPKQTENKNKCSYCGIRDQCYDEEKLSVLLENSNGAGDQILQNK